MSKVDLRSMTDAYHNNQKEENLKKAEAYVDEVLIPRLIISAQKGKSHEVIEVDISVPDTRDVVTSLMNKVACQTSQCGGCSRRIHVNW